MNEKSIVNNHNQRKKKIPNLYTKKAIAADVLLAMRFVQCKLYIWNLMVKDFCIL